MEVKRILKIDTGQRLKYILQKSDSFLGFNFWETEDATFDVVQYHAWEKDYPEVEVVFKDQSKRYKPANKDVTVSKDMSKLILLGIIAIPCGISLYVTGGEAGGGWFFIALFFLFMND